MANLGLFGPVHELQMKPLLNNRPRFGWCRSLDLDPQTIFEKRSRLVHGPGLAPANGGPRPVVVIPLPYMSAKIRDKIKEFTNGTIWPRQ